ncbi:MAG TPA: hypothetical protein VF937_00055 [Chloroflexota bacterium]
MSRRWFRHAAQVAFFGWEPAEQAFYVNVVDLCADCGGSGEVAGSEEICPGCGGEGIQLAKLNPSARHSGLSLDQVAAELARAGLPFPESIRADLETDQRSNAGNVLHEYDLDSGS